MRKRTTSGLVLSAGDRQMRAADTNNCVHTDKMAFLNFASNKRLFQTRLLTFKKFET